jgi:hypothetical protein
MTEGFLDYLFFHESVDLLIIQTKIMSEFMDDCILHDFSDLVRSATHRLNRSLKDRNPIGEGVAIPIAALGQWHPFIQTEERALWPEFQRLEELPRRCLFDDDRDVLHMTSKPLRQLVERFHDQLLKISPLHGLLSPLEGV